MTKKYEAKHEAKHEHKHDKHETKHKEPKETTVKAAAPLVTEGAPAKNVDRSNAPLITEAE